VRTVAFRNLVNAEIDTSGKDVFLVGVNGQGKTNFLEAIYFCAYASSFRGVNESELIATGEKACSVSATFSGSLNNDALVKLENGRKTIYVDGKKLEDRKELLSMAPCVVFCHEDMSFVAGSPELRRWFFDQAQSLYDPIYLDELRKYRRLLKTRNTVLRDGRADAGVSLSPLLDAVEPQIVQYGLALMKKRRRAVERFSQVCGPLYEEVSGIDGIGIRYLPSWKTDDPENIAAFLYEHRQHDLSFGATLSGPHRDRYSFIRGKHEFAARASTGQRRLLALLLRVAEAQCFSEITGNKPVLLLDDVLLELDPEKRHRFLAVMPEYDQAFYTFLPGEPYERYQKNDTLVYTVVQGGLS
jgi:DNA replication and repair protein RecF